MLSYAEKTLLINLIRSQIASLERDASRSDVMTQIKMLRSIQAKIETGGELLTAREIKLALDTAGEPDNRHYRWVVHASNIATLADALNAIQVRYAVTGRNSANV